MRTDQTNQNPHRGHRKRMKRQFLREGIDRFEPHQVLEILLFYSIPRRDTNELAHRLLDHFGGSLPAVLDAGYEQLCSVKGVSEHTATMLILFGQLLRRYQREKSDRKAFDNYNEILEFIQAQFVNEEKEKVVLLSLNNRYELLSCSTVGTGTIVSADANVRDLIQTALQHKATQVVLAHNHPAGYCSPSEEDVKTTKTLLAAFRMMEIQLIDHVIVAKDACFSMKDSPYYAPLFSNILQRLDGLEVQKK